MGLHTKIIESYGLPGCGKTTLANTLINLSRNENERDFDRLPLLRHQFGRLSILEKIKSFPFKAWLYCLLFIFSLHLNPIKKWRFCRSLFYLLLMYNAKRYVEISKIILVDHGLIQSVQSLIYGHSVTLNQKSRLLLMKILKTTHIDMLIYCDVPIETSLQRIRQRNRINNGRLDMIENDNQLLNILSWQKSFFDNVYKEIRACGNTNAIHIDTVGDVDSVAENMLQKILSI